MLYRIYDKTTQQFIALDIHGSTLFDIFSESDLVEFHIPRQITYHHTWKMYTCQPLLQAVYAHAESEVYESFDGALYNKISHTLLYVPRGKETLHIPQSMKHIGFRALEGQNIKRINVDENNPYFRVIDGCLYNNDITQLLFVPADQMILHVLPSVKYIDDIVFRRKYAEVTVAQGNLEFNAVQGVLYKKGRMVYICSDKHSVHLPAYADTESLKTLEHACGINEISIDREHPSVCAFDNIVYSKDCTKLLYIPDCVQEIYFPDQLSSLKNVEFDRLKSLSHMSIHINTSFTARTFSGLNENCRIFVRIDAFRTIELPCVEPAVLAKCIQFLKGGSAEVKPGTEFFYLDYYLLNIDCSDVFCRTIRVSSWQIIRRVIMDNCILRMKDILLDGRLITKNNINRAKMLAQEHGNTQMYTLLDSYRSP